MDREYDATMDSQGHFEIPPEVRERMGLLSGARLKLEERNSDLVIHPVTEEQQKTNLKEAIRSIIGIVPSNSKIVDHYLEEKRNEREQEDRSAGV